MELTSTLSETQATQSIGTQTRLARYLLVFFAVPLTLYLLPLIALRIPGFERWGGSTYGPALDFGFRSPGQDADVVIFGDSSALYGIDPVQMSAALGVKVINLPNTAGSLPVTGDLALRRYLSTNKKPQLLVFYFAPWGLNYTHEESSAIFEGEEMLIRNGTWSEIFAFAKNHRTQSLVFPFQF